MKGGNNMECFADKEPNKCMILINKECINCKWKKSVEQYSQDRLKYFEKECKFNNYPQNIKERLYNQLVKGAKENEEIK